MKKLSRACGAAAALVLCACLCAPAAAAAESGQLRFPDDGKLKIAVFADTQTTQNVSQNLIDGLEAVLEGRKIYQYQPGETPMPVSDESGKFFVACAAPILAEGDVLGCVLFAGEEGDLGAGSGETEYKLLQSMSGFLGRHMEG